MAVTFCRCSVVYGFVQRPLSSKKKLQQVVWVNIARHAFVQTCLNLLWLYGLSQVGPLRAMLLSEHADIVVLAVWGAVLKGKPEIILLSPSLVNSIGLCIKHVHLSPCVSIIFCFLSDHENFTKGDGLGSNVSNSAISDTPS